MAFNDNPWTSKLTQGDYTVTVNLSGDRTGVNVTGLNSITTAVDIVKPAQRTFDFVDTGLDNDNITNNGVITVNNLEVVVAAISLALILLSSPILLQAIEVEKLNSFTDTVISCSVSLPAVSVATIVTL
jgi:uncharacterized phosphosugar-binding protein